MTNLDTNVTVECDDSRELLELGKNLIAAARIGDTAAVIDFVKFGAPFATDWWGMTSLHHAALGGHLETCELLVRSGILKDARSKVEKTPLHLACQEGHAHVAMFLVANGADVHAADLVFMTPLHWAVEMKHRQTIDVLLQNGADPTLVNKFGKTCFDIARGNKSEDIINLLAEGPRVGPLTVLNIEGQRVVDIVKRRVIPVINSVKTTMQKRPHFVMSKKAAPQASAAPVGQRTRGKDQEEMRLLLEEHGIEMLDGEDANLVASAVDSGRTVILTEAGRQALSLTEGPRPKKIPGSPIKISPLRPAVVGDVKKGDESHLMATVSQKYLQAKREADQLRLLYSKKKREAEEYQNELQYIALKTMKTPNANGMATVSVAIDDEYEVYDDDTSCSM